MYFFTNRHKRGDENAIQEIAGLYKDGHKCGAENFRTGK